jgi:hypothetical protein
MSLERAKTSDGLALDRDIRLAPAPDAALSAATLVLRFYADALLRRMLEPARPVRKTRIDELSPHILRDIGWPPE